MSPSVLIQNQIHKLVIGKETSLIHYFILENRIYNKTFTKAIAILLQGLIFLDK